MESDGSWDFVPGGAHREVVVQSDLREVNDGACGAALSDCDHSLEDVREVTSNVVAAGLVGGEAESTAARFGAIWAVSPADWTHTISTVLAWCVA